MKLPKKFKEKWIIALNSGLFDQTKSALVKINEFLNEEKHISYCCLGIACIIAKIPEKEMELHGYPSEISSVAENYDKLPEFFKNNYNILKLADMNDKGKSFKQIANYIEKNL